MRLQLIKLSLISLVVIYSVKRTTCDPGKHLKHYNDIGSEARKQLRLRFSRTMAKLASGDGDNDTEDESEADSETDSETDSDNEGFSGQKHSKKKTSRVTAYSSGKTPTLSATSITGGTHPTKPSLKPTIEIATTIPTSKSSQNTTGTPSMKPTNEAPTTPLSQKYDNYFLGSGDGHARADHTKRNRTIGVLTPSTRPTEESVTSAPEAVASGYEQTKRGLASKAVTAVDDGDDKTHDKDAAGITTKEERKQANITKKNKDQEDGEDIMEENKEIEEETEGRKKAKLKDEDTEKHVLCFGDSITEGYYNGGLAFHPYSKKLSQLLNAENNTSTYVVYNEGISGECVYNEMTTRMPSILHKYKSVDLVIILGGTNDLSQVNCSEPHLFDHIIQLHTMAHKAGAKTLALTIPDSNVPMIGNREDRDHIWQRINEKIRAYAEDRKDVILCDLAEELPYRALDEDERKKYWDDNVHYTPQGYDRMAEIIYDAIQGNF